MKPGDYPKFKRFFELYNADPAFRAAYQCTPPQILQTLAIDAEPASLDAILQIPPGTEYASTHPYYLERFQRSQRTGDIVRQLRAEPIRNRKFHHWRQRQLNRIKALCHAQVFQILPHISIAFELSEGCSGQCPFCCFAPPPLQRIFPHTEANCTLWRMILEISAQIIGPMLKYAICYHATEPFDNPDYERFVRDFYELTEWWPQLTTSKHVQNPTRIRNYLKMIGEQALQSNMVRFSITSLAMLKNVHAEYRSEELEYVSLVLNNPESTYKYSPAGRARTLLTQREHNGLAGAEKFYLPGLMTCTSGFIVNLTTRTIRLVAPCNPDEQHPYGYIVFDTATFADARDYETQLLALIERNMPEVPRPDTVLAFHPQFTFEKRADGIALSTPFLTRQVPGDANWVALGEFIHAGRFTWAEVEQRFANPFVTEYYLKPKVCSLFDAGLLQETSCNYRNRI